MTDHGGVSRDRKGRPGRPPSLPWLRGLGPVVALALAAAVLPPPAAASRTCSRSCKGRVAACVRCARTDVRAARAACGGKGAARRRCRAAVREDGKATKARCRAQSGSCRACCRAGGKACATAEDPPICPIGRAVSFTPPPRRDPATLPLPPLENGHLLVIQVPGGRLELDPARRGPLTVLGRCTAWIAACVAPPDRTLDDCARSAPQCASATPSDDAAACCPSACFAAYRRSRIQAPSGEAPLDTFTRVYFDDAGCFPGVRAAVGR
jgi:hypothetical protein